MYTDVVMTGYLNLIAVYTGVIVLLWIIHRIVVALLAWNLAFKKGYKGYFWTGLFLGLLGLIYVGFLPDAKLQKYAKKICMKRNRVSDYDQYEENDEMT